AGRIRRLGHRDTPLDMDRVRRIMGGWLPGLLFATAARTGRIRPLNAVTGRARRTASPARQLLVGHSLGVGAPALLLLVVIFVVVFFVLVVVVVLVVLVVLGTAFARIQPIKFLEFAAACEFLGYGGIPHVYLSFPRPPKELRGDAQHRIGPA